MCGIAGTINVQLSPEEKAQVLSRIAHRGPDDQGHLLTENAWLANTRLAIQDLSNHGHQPMQSPDKRYTLVFNGEIYNHFNIREKLVQAGYSFRSSSDTETLLYAFMQYGEQCLQMLEGIFAFAIYDAQLQETFIARDHLGVKPLYYYRKDEQFAFASELKALTGLQGIDYTLAPEVFYNYLLFLYQPGAHTPFRHFHKLLPGHFIRVQKGTACTPQQYYHIPLNGHYKTQIREPEWITLIDNALQKAVQSQLLSDAPVGLLLSGGLDSSLVAAIAAKTHNGLPCFTINTAGKMHAEGFEDDLPFARKAAMHTGLPLHEVTGDIDIGQEFDNMVWLLDEPQADPAALHVWHISQAAKTQGIKVLLSGTGADDIFSGYRRHQALYYNRVVSLLPPALGKPAASLLKVLGKENTARRITKLFAAGNNPLYRNLAATFWLEPQQVAALFDTSHISQLPDPYHYYETLLQEIPDEHNDLNKLLFWEMRAFLPGHNLNYTDKMSMAAGVETRVPYLDTSLISLSAAIPPSLKMKGAETKYILRQVAKRYLPDEIIKRPKTGFGAPVREWINGRMKNMVRERLPGSLERWNIFNPAAINQLIQDNETGRTDAAYTIFALLAIESWLRQFAAK